MSEAERRRLKLQQALQGLVGEEVAGIMMESIPPFSWHEVATKKDLRDLRELMMADVNLAISEFRGEVREEFSEFRGEVREELARSRSDFERVVRDQTRWFMGTTVAAVVAVSALPQVLGSALG